jgi:hypothetical protein
MIQDNLFLLQILKWEPDYFRNVNDLPKQMPEDLKKYIEKKGKEDSKFVSSET